jgi:pentose-5-phosphate-3-epimerase
MKVVPAPLNYSVDECVNLLKELSRYFDTLQIDVQDGKYITNKTISLKDYLEAFKKISQDKLNLFTFDFHLQTISFEKEIKLLSLQREFIKIGFILIHYSLKPDLKKLSRKYPYFSIGIVLNPEDEVEEVIKHYDLNSLACIQIMSIHPGPQGSPFIPGTLKKIDLLRRQNYRRKILLDGAINQDTLPIILGQKNKPDVLCIGSFLTRAGDKLEERVNYLREKTG